MSVLLPDESYCTSEIGLSLYQDRKTYGFFAEVTGIKEPTSRFGFVEYEITITLTPHDSINFSPRRFKINSRFKELNRLHAQLSTIHRQLYLKDVFPGFAPAKLFGAADPETLAERKKAINTFLNFVLKNEVLCKARCFQTFISNASEEKADEKPKSTDNSLVNDPVVNDLISVENSADDEKGGELSKEEEKKEDLTNAIESSPSEITEQKSE